MSENANFSSGWRCSARKITEIEQKKCHAIAWHMGDTRFIVQRPLALGCFSRLQAALFKMCSREMVDLDRSLP